MTTLQKSSISISDELTKTKGGSTSSLAKGKVKENTEPPKAGAFDIQTIEKPSEFRRFYDRGDLPLRVDFQGATRKV